VTSERTTLYRDKQHAKLMGVCAGVADYTGIDVKWVRLAAIVLMPLTGGWALPAYFVAGKFLPKKPAHHYVDDQEQK
jgi:phage shock protein C